MIETTETRVVTVEDRHVLVRDAEDTRVVFGGEQGPAGPVGPPGPAGIEFNFAFGDATPATVVTALAGKMVYGVQLHIKVPFDGAGAALVVGDAAQANRLMAAAENDVTTVGSNTTAPAYVYTANTPILLGITPGAGATQGSGVLVLSIQQ